MVHAGSLLSCLVFENPSVIKPHHFIYHLQKKSSLEFCGVCDLEGVFFSLLSGYLHLIFIGINNLFLDSD